MEIPDLDYYAEFHRLYKYLLSEVWQEKVKMRRKKSWRGSLEWLTQISFSTLENSVAASKRTAKVFPLATSTSSTTCEPRARHKCVYRKTYTHFTLVTNYTCISKTLIDYEIDLKPSLPCSTSFFAVSQFGDNAPSGLTSEPKPLPSQTKHADCQPKQTSSLTTNFCLDIFH